MPCTLYSGQEKPLSVWLFVWTTADFVLNGDKESVTIIVIESRPPTVVQIVLLLDIHDRGDGLFHQLVWTTVGCVLIRDKEYMVIIVIEFRP